MIISALKSTSHTDTRSPIHIDTIKTLIDLEIEVWFEEGVGSGINVSDSAFAVSYTHLTLPTNREV